MSRNTEMSEAEARSWQRSVLLRKRSDVVTAPLERSDTVGGLVRVDAESDAGLNGAHCAYRVGDAPRCACLARESRPGPR